MGHYLLSIVLLSLCTFTAQALNLDERGILAAFYQGSQGDSWIDHTNWNTDEPICSWFGVKCATGLSNTSGVLALELSGNNVARQVSESLYQMPFLEKVDLRHNPVQDAGFAGMQQAAIDGSLSPLEALDFGYCLLSDVKGIEHAPATLTDIKLTKNQIAAGFPTELLQLTNLQKLYLNFNDMQGSLPTAIGNLIYLKELYLFSNKLTGPLPTEIGRLDKVQFFTLGDNLFEGSIPETVNNMLNIQIFSLHANDKGAGRLTGRVPSFSNAGYLEKLYLADNALTGPLPDDFLQHNSNIDEIVSVNLKNNMITGTLPADMDRFENLDLDLVGNMLDGPLPLSFCDKGRWMSGLVEQYGCAAILCPAGTSNSQGLQMSDEDPCAPCESIPSEFLGATQCGPPPPPPEMGILAELYLALQGSQWEEKEGWDSLDSRIKNGDVSGADLTGLDPCGFHGVICSNDAQVEILALSNNGLRGKIPSSVFLLPALEVLDMSYNYVDMDEESGGFEALKDAKKLLRLKLSHTNIASLDGIGQGTTLDEIFLDGSDFESSLPMELFDLTNLKILHLEASFLTGALPVDISRLTSLTRYVFV
jgi:Leucine-rich repeat (LRR) protein